MIVASTVINKMASKAKVFIIFTDLDGTFIPMDLSGKNDFVQIVKDIEAKGVKVKFCPISGRPAGYVLRVMHDTRDMCFGEGIDALCEFGAGEQGALILDINRSYGPQFIGHPDHKDLKARMQAVISKSRYHDVILDEPDKLYTCSLHIRSEAKKNMTHARQVEVYESLRDDILREFGDDEVNIPMSHDCMEVMYKEVSKHNAVDYLMWHYNKTYNIVGIIYAGDAENDKVAIRYVSHLAEIPGMKAHAFIPSNAMSMIESEHLETWKERNAAASKHRILKGKDRVFKGITGLIRQALNDGSLLGDLTDTKADKKTTDDIAMGKKRKASVLAQRKISIGQVVSHLDGLKLQPRQAHERAIIAIQQAFAPRRKASNVGAIRKVSGVIRKTSGALDMHKQTLEPGSRKSSRAGAGSRRGSVAGAGSRRNSGVDAAGSRRGSIIAQTS